MTTQEKITGEYTMTQVNGQNLPVIVSQSSEAHDEFTGGSIALQEVNNFYVTEVQIRTTLNSGTVYTRTGVGIGTYSVVDSIITFSPDGATPFTGTIRGGVLTYKRGDLSITYRKRK